MRGAPAAVVREASRPASPAAERRVLAVAFGAHALHDGYADALYYLLTMLVVVSLVVLVTLPLAWRLRGPLSAAARRGAA